MTAVYFNDCTALRRVWRYQSVIRFRKGHTAQWPTEKGQKDKQRFTKHTHKTKDRVNELL
jgi:hypothetical protein